jgi:tetratricopeptide (TPR) repeat protein
MTERTTSGYEIASLTEIESIPVEGTLRWTPLRRHFGITAFGVSAYTAAEAGHDVVEEHTEEGLGHEELYVVVSGRATFILDGEEKDVPAGSVVAVRDPKVNRYARAAEPGTTVLAIGGKPGVHDVSTWEYVFMAYGVAAEDPARGLTELQAALEAKPDDAALHYHLACLQARAGRLEEARTSLDRALELDPSRQAAAEADEDLAALRVAGEP